MPPFWFLPSSLFSPPSCTFLLAMFFFSNPIISFSCFVSLTTSSYYFQSVHPKLRYAHLCLSFFPTCVHSFRLRLQSFLGCLLSLLLRRILFSHDGTRGSLRDPSAASGHECLCHEFLRIQFLPLYHVLSTTLQSRLALRAYLSFIVFLLLPASDCRSSNLPASVLSFLLTSFNFLLEVPSSYLVRTNQGGYFVLYNQGFAAHFENNLGGWISLCVVQFASSRVEYTLHMV